MKVELNLESDSLYIQMNGDEAESEKVAEVENIASLSGATEKDVQNGTTLPHASDSILDETFAQIMSEEVQIAPVMEEEADAEA